MRKILRLHITQAASETRYKESDEDSSTSEDSEIEELVMTLISIKKKRYLAERVRLERAPDITKYLFRLDTGRFKQEFRMSQDSFYQLLDLIKDNSVFHNNSNVPQRPVRDQLMVTLRQTGMSGNGSSVGVLARFFRILEGTVILYCSRVVEAILALESTYVVWPNHEAREAIASDIADSTGFKQCVGFIDGTLLPLDEKPSIDAQDYYS
ncbi:uncharacterized protein PGTG_15076 [Puccinia graminis f. sp. tritici CRL 75-36-700-3]|uniref:DDE Tnp4 domain-containing protein n=1 Tax=Puccinia graminis f. sp. tritici (strain CRL 75-36-700-3 / race SCCL) TaxID=418459 RepID=E3KY34_PUCGT|nr:uncharacterized protein PGTG_15076 [Puccinia graminis f. sp. tritici CRL 75-36-700-3]EFP89235.1 hypothetical protein PGTG_15076 [Puccinia graminis f. sp. tritici CRL 75-36-700-3]